MDLIVTMTVMLLIIMGVFLFYWSFGSSIGLDKNLQTKDGKLLLNPSKPVLYNYVLMMLLSFCILISASNGEFFLDLYKHIVVDGLFFVLFLFLGYKIGKYPCNTFSMLLLSLFYYLLFVSFTDGHLEWTHTHDIFNKLFYIFVESIIFMMSIFVPLGVLLISFLHSRVINYICKKQDL